MRGALPAAAAVGAAVLAAGCSVFSEPFEPQGSRAAAARAAAQQVVEAVLDAVIAGSREHGRLRADACHEGQDNWKRVDAYAWECRLGVGALIDGAETRDGVAEALSRLHARLDAAGCRPRDGRGLLDVVTEYWLPLRDRAGYGPQSLPGQVYTCSGDTMVEVLSSSPGAADLARNVEDPFGSGFAGETGVSRQSLSAEGLASARASASAQLLIVRATKRYYAIRN